MFLPISPTPPSGMMRSGVPPPSTGATVARATVAGRVPPVAEVRLARPAVLLRSAIRRATSGWGRGGRVRRPPAADRRQLDRADLRHLRSLGASVVSGASGAAERPGRPRSPAWRGRPAGAASMSTLGSMAMSSSIVSRRAAWRNAAAGWYMAKVRCIGRAGPRIDRPRVPWATLIRAPGLNVPSEWRPRVTTTAGSRISSCRVRYGAQAAISSGSGSRLPGGRHLTTLVMKTSSRFQPIGRSRSLSRVPAAPTNGRPCWSSL